MSLDAIDLARLDPGGMLREVADSPQQWRDALDHALAGPPPRLPDRIGAVVVVGMGGSGIAGDVAATFARERGTVPVIASKDYDLPAFVGATTLVIAVSYSGDTEETLAAVAQARKRGAAVFSVTSGGALAEQAEQHGEPAVRVPPGRPPRASLGYLSVPVLVTLERAGVTPGLLPQLRGLPSQVAEAAAAWDVSVPQQDNEAKQAAAALHGLVPVFHGGRGIPGLVASRAACQVNENAKSPAIAATLPELDHNAVMGWAEHGATADHFGLLDLRSPRTEHPQVARRFEATAAVTADAFGVRLSHTIRGDTAAARLACGALFADYLSVYLAFCRDVDPTPVEAIEELKRLIAAPVVRDD